MYQIPYTIGIHWFNGSPYSAKFKDLAESQLFPTTGSIYPYVKKYLDKNLLLNQIIN